MTIISWVWGYIVFQKALYPEKGSRILPSKNVERFVSRDSVDKLLSEVGQKLGSFDLGLGGVLPVLPPTAYQSSLLNVLFCFLTSEGLAFSPWGKPDLKSFF